MPMSRVHKMVLKMVPAISLIKDYLEFPTLFTFMSGFSLLRSNVTFVSMHAIPHSLNFKLMA